MYFQASCHAVNVICAWNSVFVEVKMFAGLCLQIGLSWRREFNSCWIHWSFSVHFLVSTGFSLLRIGKFALLDCICSYHDRIFVSYLCLIHFVDNDIRSLQLDVTHNFFPLFSDAITKRSLIFSNECQVKEVISSWFSPINFWCEVAHAIRTQTR